MDASWAQEKFEQAVDEDLDTPGAVNVLVDLAEKIVLSGREGRDILEAQELLKKTGWVFGVQFGGGPEARVVEGLVELLRGFEH